MSLLVEDLTMRIGDREVVRGVRRSVPDGGLLAVVGPSGAGKTTVLSAVAGLVRPEAGRVLLDGKPVTDGDRARIGVVLQPVVLAARLTVAENVGLALQAARRPALDVVSVTERLLTDLGLDGVGDRLPAELSGGQRQRAAVARAVAATPRLVVADEPTSDLDGDNRHQVLTLLRAVAATGAVVVVATHDPEVAESCTEVLTVGAAG